MAAYDAITKPALRRLERAVVADDLAEIKAAAEGAIRAGASINDILEAVGGPEAWSALVQRIRRLP